MRPRIKPGMVASFMGRQYPVTRVDGPCTEPLCTGTVVLLRMSPLGETYWCSTLLQFMPEPKPQGLTRKDPHARDLLRKSRFTKTSLYERGPRATHAWLFRHCLAAQIPEAKRAYLRKLNELRKTFALLPA
jgi:hypothetical protein